MIGIITFQDTTNYGAMLQSYALQRCINNAGQDCEIINYDNKILIKNEHPMKLKEQHGIHGIIRYFVLVNSQKKRYTKFQAFYTKYIKSSNKRYNEKNIVTSNELYTKFIAGSDQIWNADLTGIDLNYLLSFVDEEKGRYSYASSLGGYIIPSDLISEYSHCLKKFKVINVREADGVDQIYKLFGIKSNLVLDPTLLLNAKEWDKIATTRLIKEDYIVVYFIERNKENFDCIRKFAKEKKLTIIYLQNFIKTERKMINNRDASPEEFLSYIKYAKYVFTGSFHGLCFSIIYNKNFFLTYSPAKMRQNRLDNLLQQLKIKPQFISDIILSKTANNLNYLEINKRLLDLRNESLAYLDRCLE